MDTQEFSSLCEKAHMTQEKKFSLQGYDVYIADGMAICKEMNNKMAYRTIIAVGGTKRAKGKMDVMMPIFFDKDLIVNKNKKHRISKAIEHSKLMVAALVKAEAIGDKK